MHTHTPNTIAQSPFWFGQLMVLDWFHHAGSDAQVNVQNIAAAHKLICYQLWLKLALQLLWQGKGRSTFWFNP